MSQNLFNIPIHNLNTSTHVYLDVIKNIIEDNDNLNTTPFLELRKEFNTFNNILDNKGIQYSDLKTALIPTQKNKNEVLFIFDAKKLSEINFFYGEKPYLYILDKLSAFKNSNFIVYKGDLIINDEEARKKIINHINNTENIINKLVESGRDYYFIYIKGLGNSLLDEITNGINEKSLFCNGYIVCNNEIIIKSIISKTLIQEALFNRKNVILSNPDDNSDINLSPFDYSSYGYTVVGIFNFYYLCFLTYKIESIIFDKDEVNNAINFTQEKKIDISNFSLEIDERKYDYIMNSKNIKSKSEDKSNLKMYESDLKDLSHTEFYKFISEVLTEGDIFNIELTCYGIKFNKKIYIKNSLEKYYSFIIGFEIKEEDKKIRLITMY